MPTQSIPMVQSKRIHQRPTSLVRSALIYGQDSDIKKIRALQGAIEDNPGFCLNMLGQKVFDKVVNFGK